jgi:hypothetical protein
MTAIPTIDSELAERVFRARCEARAILHELGELTLEQAIVVFPTEGRSSATFWAAFWAACRKADARRRQLPEDPAILRARRLLADDVTLERAYAELNTFSCRAARSVIEALMLSFERGVSALDEPDSRQRLRVLNDDQALEVAGRVQRFRPEIGKPWTADEVEILMSLRETLR